MAKNLYTGINGTARSIRGLYFGANTEFPIYEERRVQTNITADNINTIFTVENGTHYFKGAGSVFTSTNQWISDSTASTTLTAKKDIEVSFNYSYSSEIRLDFFTLDVAGTRVCTGSGPTTQRSFSGTLKAGEVIRFAYKKDSSDSEYDDCCTFSDMVTVEHEKAAIGTETREVARRIKKVYVGVEGVARLCYEDSGS